MCSHLYVLVVSPQDFQLQQLQQKLNRLEGERSDEEKTALHARIKAGQTQLDLFFVLCSCINIRMGSISILFSIKQF